MDVRVGMVGPALDASGGIAAVARAWLDSPELADVEVRYFPSMTDGAGIGRVVPMASGQLRFVGALAAGWRPDVYHLHVTQHTSFWRKLLYFREALATGRPIVVHIHGSNGFEVLHDRYAASGWVVEWMLRRAAAVIVVSRQMAGIVRRWIGDAHPVSVLYNPVSVDDFARSPGVSADGRPTVLYMGLISDAKGAFDLLATVPEVAARVPNVRFRFAGNGEVDRLVATARRLGVHRFVEAPGWLSGDAKRRAFADASLYALPSYAEGLPVSVLEAMASALPVVATPIAGIPEAVIEGETGYLVRPGDRHALAERIVRVLTDRRLSVTLGAAGHARARACFDRDALVHQLKGVWEQARRRLPSHEARRQRALR